MPKILIIEDEEAIQRVLRNILTREKYDVDVASDGVEGLKKIKSSDYDVVLCDIKMPRKDGLEVLEEAKKINPQLPFVMISGHGDLETAVESMRKGAYDYIQKPPDLNRLLTTLRNAQTMGNLVKENVKLKKKVSKKYTMIGESEALRSIREMIDKVAPTDARVLITGPNGTGKELVAHQLHEKSKRAKGPMVEVNCAAIPSELIESELFGHMKGSFTGAHKDKKGKFEQAHGGTLFLDEVGDLSLAAQAKVLRALQESKISRVGSDKDIKVDVRVIAATNKDLKKEISEGRFREDLYHRLAVIEIKVPSLDERKEDIPLLVEHFVKQIAEEQNMKPKRFTKDAIRKLQSYTWSGNIRELRNIVERLMILGGDEITADDVKTFSGKE
ncbi:MAG: sigma-54-dependent Fis family transcriptional regulator [Chlorobi bacterium]|nr:sigma-54-dependent Fis family transcriptional regulator [Chlorobiota bacterium]